MTWFLAILIVLLIGGVVVVAAGVGEGLPPADTDLMPPLSGSRPLTAEDLRGVRFNTVAVGYRAAEVDALLDRLAAQLDDQGSSDGESRSN